MGRGLARVRRPLPTNIETVPMKKAVWLALSLVLTAPAAHAQIYKCIAGGRTAFQSMPCSVEGGMTPATLNVRDTQQYPWSGLRAGMSVEEVRLLVPGATPVKSGSRLSNGAEARLQKPVTVAGVRFTARYFFLKGRYYQVNVSRDGEAYDNSEVRSDYEKVEPMMLRIFGKPDSQTPLALTHQGLKGRVEWEGKQNFRAWAAIIHVSAHESMMTFGHRPSGVPSFNPAAR